MAAVDAAAAGLGESLSKSLREVSCSDAVDRRFLASASRNEGCCEGTPFSLLANVGVEPKSRR